MLGLPYAMMALMMTFLHDNSMAATPWGIIGAAFRLGGTYVLLCLFVASVLAVGAAAFWIAFLLREPLLVLPGGLPRLLDHRGLDCDGRDADHGDVLRLPQGTASLASRESAVGDPLEALTRWPIIRVTTWEWTGLDGRRIHVEARPAIRRQAREWFCPSVA